MSRLVLGLETSCDETSAAVIADGRRILSNVISSQIPIHQKYGGVVPELASRRHLENVVPVIDQALAEAGVALADLHGIGVTHGPGLVGALLVGVAAAKALAFAAGIPLLGVHHLEGHIFAALLTHPELEPPFVSLVVSGGHTSLVHVRDYSTFELLGQTRDDAAGEAFDKIARVLGLPYPGGPNLEKLALAGNPDKYRFHSAFNEGEGFDFSFSGIKTAVVNRLHQAAQTGEAMEKADLAASFQKTVVDILAEKSIRATLMQKGNAANKLALAGGVSANKALRSALQERARKAGISFYCPDFAYCTDNAAMVGSAAFGRLMCGHPDPLSLNAVPYLSIESEA